MIWTAGQASSGTRMKLMVVGGEFEEPDDLHRRLEKLVMGSQGDKLIAGVCAQFACDRKRRGNDSWGRIAGWGTAFGIGGNSLKR